MPVTRAQKKFLHANLISATRISNTIKNDKIIDYLDLLEQNGLEVSENLSVKRKRSESKDFNDSSNVKYNKLIGVNVFSSQKTQTTNKKKTSFDYIVENGYLFEYDIINKIKGLMKMNNELNKLIDINETNIDLNCSKTIQTIISNTHTVILGSVLINSSNNTWGKPDLIVKGCWIEHYIRDKIVGLDLSKWYIIDIKSSTIQLINGGEDISSKLLYSVYKSQIYIYTQALNNLLLEYGFNNNVVIGFILGKRYKYVLNKNQIVKNSFDCMGIVDFNKEKSKGNDLKKIINEGIEWINELKTNWRDFTLNPINKDELYPNMKNIYSKNWYNVKKNIAHTNKELSLLWYCGISNRVKAWNNGIRSYMDINLTPDILGFEKTDSKYEIIQSMLKLLHLNKSNYILDKKNNLMEWQNKSKWEFFIDFETYNSNETTWDEANEWNSIYNESQCVYMCGVSWICPDTNKFFHKVFIINYPQINMLKKEFDNDYKNNNDCNNLIMWNDCVCCSDELDLIKKINKFIFEFKPVNMEEIEYFNQTRLIHWSGAEPIIYNKKINEYGVDKNKYKLNWYDLLNVFKYPKYPIVIKECFSFGLKNVVRKLNELGEIKIEWEYLDDGLLSSFIAKEIYTNPNSNLDVNKNIYEIIKYNLIDCKAMLELIKWMRKCVE